MKRTRIFIGVALIFASLVVLALAAYPARAADAGVFIRLHLSGPLPKGQAFYVEQTDTRTNPTAFICGVGAPGELPFVAGEGPILRFRIYARDETAGETTLIRTLCRAAHPGMVVRASYRTA